MDQQSFSSRSFGLDRSVALGLAAALVFFIVSGWLGYLNTAALLEGNQRITQTHRAILALDQMLALVQDAETGQRGFLLTNQDSYLEPYHAAVAAIPSKLDEIQDLVGADQTGAVTQIRQRVQAKIDELDQTIALRRDQGLEAALAIVRSNQGQAEMDAIRNQLATVSDAETAVRLQRLAEMDKAQRTAILSTIFSSLAGIVLACVIGFLMRQETLSRRRRQWLQAGQVGLATALLGDKHADELADAALDFLADYTGAIAGALFVGNHAGYRRASVHGVPPEAYVPTQFHLRQGLLGQAAAEKKSIVVSDVPSGYLSYGSALGQAKPAHLAVVPGAVDGAVNSVLELGFLRPMDKAVLELLEDSSDAVAVAVRAALFRGELQALLEETQRQSEELQAQSEELRVSNEELEEQGRALKESQSRLEQQQEELEQTNSQLEEQAQALETQRDDLERTNATVEAKARELEQASQYKSDFLANMSHELRTPLNSSLILAKLLADNPDDNLTPEQVRFAQTIESSGNDLLNLINDILDLSKIEAGHVEIHPQPTPVERVAGGLRQLFQPIAEQKNLDFRIDIDPEAPTMVETDPQRLEQVLKNLLSNAFKFTAKGAVTLAVKPVGTDALAFAVTDTGIGIAPDQQRRVFEAFHQADSTISRKYGGTGLGLSISRQLVRLLGGSIDLQSIAGQGSTFVVTIPMMFAAPVEEPSRPAERPAYVEPAPAPAAPVPARVLPVTRVEDDRRDLAGSNRVLLIVEDDQVFAGILREMAHELQFRTLVAGTAAEALELAREFLPNAVVLDIGLPDQSGLSVLDRLKGDVRTRHIPVHVVSASDETAAALSLGAVGHALKPVRKDQLFEVLRKLEDKFADKVHRVLIVEDDPVQRDAMSKLLGSQDVVTVSVGTAQECLQQLKDSTFDCMVLDLSLPDASGYSLLETLSEGSEYAFPPVIVYTGRDLSPDDELRLRRYSKSIIIKGAKSPERLLDEVSLFLHQVVAELPDEQQRMIRKARSRDALLEGRRILIVEDDVRNVYALTNILEPRGAITQIARNGREALDALDRASTPGGAPIDLILMDVMMPVMDGLEATREIRKSPRLRKLPIIALTAKAMPDDQQRCIEAGANDYMAKPLDVERLLSLVRVWMPK